MNNKDNKIPDCTKLWLFLDKDILIFGAIDSFQNGKMAPFCLLENVTRAPVNIVVSGKWVNISFG